MSDDTIVVLGAGAAGIVAAGELRNRLKNRGRIIVVEKSLTQSFQPSYLWVTIGERRRETITRDISKLERKGMEVVNGEVEKIDVKKRCVRAGGQEIEFDYLIIALGAELDPKGVPGSAEAHTYYSLEGAERLRDEIRTFAGGKIVTVVPSLPYKCPSAPYEGAMLLEGYFHSRHARHKVELSIYTPEPSPIPVAGPGAGESVQELLAHKGVTFHGNVQLTRVKNGTAVFDDGTSVPYDLLITVPPHRAPKVVRDAKIVDESGWIPVNNKTLETEHEGVFAIGDVTRITLQDGMMLPKAGTFAHGQAEVVARNLAARILGQAKREQYDGSGYCFLETGGGLAGMAQGNFYSHPRHISLRTPSPVWHWGKVAFERYWLWKWY
jgi:sulfide:quinone oxidoreductase